MKTNTIITIGRQFGSAGREIGYQIADYFGIKLYDKEMLSRAAKERGICEEIFETHDEKPRKSPIIGFELLAGERRFRASKIAGLELVPAIIKELTDQEMMRQAIIENLQREDLNPIEEAISYQKLVDHGYKHDQIAQFMGKSRPYISNMLRLLHLAPSVQEAVIQNDISSAHARVLVPLDEEEQRFWLERIKQDHLNVRTLENKISSKRKQKNKKIKESFLLEEEQRLKKILGTEVTIHSSSQNNVVPDSAKVWIDMRLVPPTDTAAAKAIVDRAIRKAEEEIPGVKGSYIITGDRPYVEKDDHSKLLANLKAAVKQTTGEEAVVGSFNGYTDTAVIAGTLMNHNCMSYGPGSLELAHKPNEFVPYEDVCRVQKVLTKLAENVLFG